MLAFCWLIAARSCVAILFSRFLALKKASGPPVARSSANFSLSAAS